MKVTKNQLKTLIKECLIEILSEGLGQEALSEVRRHKQFQNVIPVKEVKQSPKPSRILEQAVVDASGGNDIMRSILADTAATTFPKMLDADKGHSSSQLQEQVSGTPEEIFGSEVTEKWAALAFSQPKLP